MGKDSKPKKRSLDEGLWLMWGLDQIPVKTSKITADKITPQPIIRWGKPDEKGRIEVVETAHWPVFRSDIVAKIKEGFKAQDFTAQQLFPKDPIADTRLDNLINAVVTFARTIPLETYERSKVDRHLNKVEDAIMYQVKGVVEGKEKLEPFPHLTTTHQIEVSEQTLWPRIYLDLWLRDEDKEYELYSYDDMARFKLWNLVQLLNNCPVGKDGRPILDKAREPEVVGHEEMMIVKEGYNATSGSSSQYHALISSKRIIGEGGKEQFILVMKLCKSIEKFAHAMNAPLEGESPIVTQTDQKPVIVESFAEMLRAVVAPAQ